MIRVQRLAVPLWLAATLDVSGCRDAGSARPSSVSSAQIVALEAEPAEAVPSGRVSYRVLAVDRHGELDLADLALAYCRTPLPATENRVANDACASRPEQPIAAQGAAIEATVPADACALYGPSVPAGVRPPDPDATGGYYQPVRVEADAIVALGLQRIRCALADAPIDVAREFRDRYVPNRNPALTPLSAWIDGKPVPLDAVPRGRELRLVVGWPADAAESFVVYDRASVSLVEQREAMRVSWYVTAGELAYDRTGRAADDDQTVTANRWQAPSMPGRVHLWLVLRDGRGGTTHASYAIDVR